MIFSYLAIFVNDHYQHDVGAENSEKNNVFVGRLFDLIFSVVIVTNHQINFSHKWNLFISKLDLLTKLNARMLIF